MQLQFNQMQSIPLNFIFFLKCLSLKVCLKVKCGSHGSMACFLFGQRRGKSAARCRGKGDLVLHQKGKGNCHHNPGLTQRKIHGAQKDQILEKQGRVERVKS